MAKPKHASAINYIHGVDDIRTLSGLTPKEALAHAKKLPESRIDRIRIHIYLKKPKT